MRLARGRIARAGRSTKPLAWPSSIGPAIWAACGVAGVSRRRCSRSQSSKPSSPARSKPSRNSPPDKPLLYGPLLYGPLLCGPLFDGPRGRSASTSTCARSSRTHWRSQIRAGRSSTLRWSRRWVSSRRRLPWACGRSRWPHSFSCSQLRERSPSSAMASMAIIAMAFRLAMSRRAPSGPVSRNDPRRLREYRRRSAISPHSSASNDGPHRRYATRC